MQSSNSLIALGIGAVIAVGAIGTPATAEAGIRHRQDAKATATSTSESETDRPLAQSRAEDRLDQLQTESQIRQQLNQSQFGTSNQRLTTGTNALSLDQQIQQQLNVPDLQVQGASTSSSESLDRLQFEQRVRRTLQPTRSVPEQQSSIEPTDAETEKSEAANAATANTATASAATASAETASPETRDSTSVSSEVAASKTEKSETTNSETTNSETVNAETVSSDAVSSDAVSSDAATVETPNAEAASPARVSDSMPTTSTTSSAASDSEPDSEAVNSSNRAAQRQTRRQQNHSEATSTDEPTSDSPASAEDSRSTETVKPETASERESSQSPEASESAEVTDSADPAQTRSQRSAQSGSASSPLNPAEPSRESAPIPGVPAPAIDQLGNQSDNDSTNNGNLDLLNGSPAPEYLDPSPNPLFFPTQTEEVELVGTQPITLKQAIELAIRNNPDLQQAQLQLERSQADLRNTQSANYPTLDANARFTQSGAESPQIDTRTTLGTDSQGIPIPNPDVGEPQRVYQDSTIVGTGLELNYTIFSSGRRSALIEAARSQVRLQQLDVERQTEQLILDTSGDYYDLQQAGAQVNIFSANLAQAEQSLRDAQALERAGVGTRFDVLQAEVDVANARQRLTQQLSNLEVSRRELAQRLNLAQTVNVSAADSIEVAGVWDLSLEESIVQGYKNRVELEQQLIQREIAQKNRQAALAQLGPQVGFRGTFDVSTDIDQAGGPNYNYSLGLNASLALYDGGAARSQANREESNIAIADSQFEGARDQIRLEIERGYSQLNASFTNIQTTALAVEQAAEALRLARLRFQAGVGTQTDVLRQQSVLAEAQVNNLTAILDYNRALAVLQRGVSNYPDGYLNDAP